MYTHVITLLLQFNYSADTCCIGMCYIEVGESGCGPDLKHDGLILPCVCVCVCFTGTAGDGAAIIKAAHLFGRLITFGDQLRFHSVKYSAEIFCSRHRNHWSH